MDTLRVQVQKTLPAVAELVRPWLAGAPEPLRDTLPPQSLGDPDSRWVRVNDIDLHYKQVCPSSFMKFFLCPKNADLFHCCLRPCTAGFYNNNLCVSSL